MHPLNYISTIIKYSFYIFCINGTRKMWITVVFTITAGSWYALEEKKEEISIKSWSWDRLEAFFVHGASIKNVKMCFSEIYGLPLRALDNQRPNSKPFSCFSSGKSKCSDSTSVRNEYILKNMYKKVLTHCRSWNLETEFPA